MPISPYITGETPAVGDRVLYSDKSKYGSTYHNYGWADTTNTVVFPIPCGEIGTVKSLSSWEVEVQFDFYPSMIFGIDPRLFERVASTAQNSVLLDIENGIASAPTVRTCICAITELMQTGCTCGAIDRHVPAKLA